jgi:uncharacterized membrane protein
MTIGAVAYAVAYLLLDYNRFGSYDSGGDFGMIMQSVSDTSGLLRDAVEGSHFAEHFSPIYDLAVPFTHFSNSIIPLMLFQVASGALVSLGLFELGRKLLPEKLAFAVASIALVYPALAGVIFGDPYENVFAPAVTVWLAYTVYTRKWALASVMVIAALMVKEDQAVFLTWAGALLLAWSMRRNDVPLRRFSIGVIATSLAVLLAFVFLIRPEFAGDHDWSSLQKTLQASGSHSGFDLFGRLGYLAEVMIPLALLPFLSWRILLFAVPSLAEVILSPNAMVWTMGQHYAGVWIGYVLTAALFGVYALYQSRPILAKRLVTISIVICIADLAFGFPVPARARRIGAITSTSNRRTIERLTNCWPRGCRTTVRSERTISCTRTCGLGGTRTADSSAHRNTP